MINTQRIREVLDHAEEFEGVPGIAWGWRILNFNDIRELCLSHETLMALQTMRANYEDECG